ncbi:MAG: energy-coupling factor transporter transmembrane protein EcfT [Ktedonobacteraceae bacterium]|nr:energy-coupling factor transporter transmembrane protein EcfT [Ktedonobacteraceae bacterium]
MLINFPYVEKDTPLHRLDVRAKLLLLLTLGIALAQTSNIWVILIALLFTVWYYRLAGLTWLETKRAWYMVIALNTMIVLGNYFLSGGSVISGVDVGIEHTFLYFPFPGLVGHAPFVGLVTLHLSVENLAFLATVAMRNFAIALVAISLPFTTKPAYVALGFRGLGLPDSFAYAIDLAFRFLPTLGRDFGTTLDAQRARGFELDKLRGGLFSKIARTAPLIVPLVIGSIIGAEDIINAMELRCFGIGKRSWLMELRPRRVDRMVIALTLLGFVLITALNIIGGFASGWLHFLHVQGIPLLS